VMFLSDNGMAVPFAKANCYLRSTQTPWIVRWPDRVKPGTVDGTHLISGIDFMPTVLQVAELASPEGLDGRSLVPLLAGQSQADRDLVFTEFHRTSARRDFPMRCVQGSRFGYLYNAWANKTKPMRMDSTSGRTFRAMQEAAANDEAIAARVALFEHRVPEEFYDFENDPDGLHNLIDDPAHAGAIQHMRAALRARMERTGDFLLETFSAEVPTAELPDD
jgi:N-sulfoglucosamine sulfohydrolase